MPYIGVYGSSAVILNPTCTALCQISAAGPRRGRQAAPGPLRRVNESVGRPAGTDEPIGRLVTEEVQWLMSVSGRSSKSEHHGGRQRQQYRRLNAVVLP
jgi:hypothetical protein